MTEIRTIGELKVTLAGLGCNNFGRRLDESRSADVARAALEAGVTLFDTADIYGEGRSEEFLGRALGARRDEAVIVSKFGMLPPPEGPSGGNPDYIKKAATESLRRLGTDRIDLYLIHRPDPDTPIGDTLGALNELIDQGKVREIGCSNFSAAQVDEAAAVAKENGLRGFATVQNQYSLLHREPEDGVLGACERLGTSFMPYFPLASGVLTGKYRRGAPVPAGARLAGSEDQAVEDVVGEDRLGAVERLSEFAASRGHTLLDLALSWLAGRPTIATVIAGATTADQLRANAAATSAWNLSSEDLARVDEILGVAG
jgi:aryl-alcohol dehydrogenase-like predicted oxidoreductase